MKKNLLTIIALTAVLVLVLAGCGGKEPVETNAGAAAPSVSAEAPALGLSSFKLSTSTWSSPNGATVHLDASPMGYAKGQSAVFIVRLEGEEVANVPCEWNGESYTASADLNAADGLCYYVLMTAADGTTAEVPVNTPSIPTEEALINMASSLESYCNLMVESSSFENGKLTITAGSVKVQAPRITNDGEAITVSETSLVLRFNGQEAAKESLTLSQTEEQGAYELALDNLSFEVPEMEDDQQLTLELNITLSNGQTLTAAGGSFFYSDGQLLTTVG